MTNYLQKTIKIFVLLAVAFELSSCKELVEALTPADVFISSVIESGPESGGERTVEVALNKAIESDVTFEIEYSGTAVFGQDYGYSSSQVTILAGETTADISFSLYDNNLYEPDANKTVIIELITISGEGVNFVSFGDFIKHTFNIQEDDMEIVLSWSPSSGVADDHDLDLGVEDGANFGRYSSSSSAITETVLLYGSDADATYYAFADHFSGSLTTVSVNFTITLNYPNGITDSHSDTFTNVDNTNRNLWSIEKSGVTYTSSQDPFGENGRKSSAFKIPESAKSN